MISSTVTQCININAVNNIEFNVHSKNNTISNVNIATSVNNVNINASDFINHNAGLDTIKQFKPTFDYKIPEDDRSFHCKRQNY